MPITAWQICHEHQDYLSGEQSNSGARWNSPGPPVVYLAEHPSLAVLEMRAHLDKPYDAITHDHVPVRVLLPDDLTEIAELPEDPRPIGDAWMRDTRRAVLRVPSVIVREGRNLLLNPRHPRAAAARVEACTPFRFDRRLWGGT